MDTVRKVGLVGLGIVLFVSLVGANATVALDRTALDSEFTKDKAAEAGLYETFAEELRGDLGTDETADDDDWPLERSRGELMEAALTDEYIRSQGEENIDAIYAYLHGETGELRLEFDTEPLRENLLAEAESDVESIDLGDIEMPYGEEIERMASSQTAFDDARAEFRDERKTEIQEETERELSDEELTQRLDESMDDIREEMLTEMDEELEGEFEGAEAELEEPVRTLQTARIDALTGEVTYEEYTETVESARVNLGEAFLGIVESELDEEFPETIDVTEGMGEDELEVIETAQTGVSAISALALVLPVFALVVAGGIGYLAPRSIAALEIGAVSLVVGLVGAIGSVVAADQFRSVFDTGEMPPGMGEFLVAFVTGILGAITWQSVFLLIVGGVAVGIGVAMRKGYIE